MKRKQRLDRLLQLLPQQWGAKLGGKTAELLKARRVEGGGV